MRRFTGLTLALGLAATALAPVDALAASLRGSPAAMAEQNRMAKEHGLDFYRTPEQIQAAVERGTLVPLEGNENYEVADFVRYPFLQPELRVFIERLSAQYRAACDQKLVVTSAVRPTNGQPSNSHQLSVHPAGMAVDLRVSDRAECRSWLEGTLLSLERKGVLNGIREFHPPHYHVAVYPEQYMAHVAELQAAEDAERLAAEAAAEKAAAEAVPTLAALPVAAGFVPTAEPAGPAGPTTPRGALAATLALVLALPVGVGVLARRLLKR